MEIVGSIASITQLLRYALSLIATISSIYKNLQGGPALQHQRLKQLERLFCTVQTLNETSALNKASTKDHLTAIVVRIQDLRVLLERLAAQQTGRSIKKYLKALVKENREQNRILEVFIDLEKEKSALLLSIAETHTELSARIYNKLFEQSPPCTQATQIEMPLEKKKASAKDKEAKHSRANEGRPDERQETPLAGGPTDVDNAEEILPNADDVSRKMTGHIYESISFSGRADIHAGNIGESKSGDERSQKHRYQKIEAKEGRAICGDAYCDGYLDKFFEEKK